MAPQIGLALKTARAAKGETLDKTARAAGKSASWLSYVEADKRRIFVDDLISILSFLGIEVVEFFEEYYGTSTGHA